MYLIGGEVFKSKKAISERAKEYLNSPAIEFLPGSECYVFLHDLLKQTNPRYLNRGHITCFRVEMNEWQSFVFEIQREDDRRETFSYTNCVKSLGHTPKENIERRVREQRTSAYRLAVEPQIIAFRELPYQGVCRICYNHIPIDEVRHVDHIILFKYLVARFERQVKLKVPNQFARDASAHDAKTKYLVTFRPEDVKYEQAWCDYHKKHAQLRVVCESCNGTRTYGYAIDEEGMDPVEHKRYGIHYHHVTGELKVYDYISLLRHLRYGRGFNLGRWGDKFVTDVWYRYMNWNSDYGKRFCLSDKQKDVLARMALFLVGNPDYVFKPPRRSNHQGGLT